ncbi:hypothetical protein FE257_007239 [Aspergillus nanangensis]|uniref:Uncharacterized protein n=1 Tax=Aspergillus nanangensis TaxID=2582783 RepID=A0AAD4GTG5_ASPNN|nr:hypothetical protein FE257_007239 [Aspergillus nanangensis]
MLGRWTRQRLQRHTVGLPWLRPPTRTIILDRHACKARPQKSIGSLKHPPSRCLFISAIPPALVPPTIFVGLLLGLWAWKCFWIVILQDKLLYLAWLPPLARSETIESYAAESKPVLWKSSQIRSLDGTKLTVCEGHIPVSRRPGEISDPNRKRKSVVICYFQGNGGSTPMRLPLLSQVLRSTRELASSTPLNHDIDYTIVALSYRGYWTSSGRAAQPGIELDAQAFLQWVSKTYSAPDIDLEVVLWGHSLGSAIASSATVTYLSRLRNEGLNNQGPPLSITGLILEAPTSSVKEMLISLYPQKWLPYRYLWPFLRSHWSNATSMERMAHLRDQFRNEKDIDQIRPPRSIPPILLLSAENDEVIPPHVPGDLNRSGRDLGLDIQWTDVRKAMHIEAPLKVDGRKALVNFILKASSPGSR